MNRLETLKIKLFADLAELDRIEFFRGYPLIRGFTTNPTLMRKAGVQNYEDFGRRLLAMIDDRPVSIEVIADDFALMERQARHIAGWGGNVRVKIPVTDTAGNSAAGLIARLSADGIKVNVTAVMTLEQVAEVTEALAPETPAIVSVFAGRIADTGCDPVPVMVEARRILEKRPQAELLWASPRELINLFQAEEAGCHILTATPDILAKLPFVDKDLTLFSRETVAMFHRDATAAGYRIEC